MNTMEEFKEGKLPPKECFYSILTMESITVENYERAKQIWVHFNIQTMGQYHDLYLRLMYCY